MRARFDIAALIQRAVRLRATARQVNTIKQRAIGTLRRRMPVRARRDIQDFYNLPAGRLRRDLGSAAYEGGVEVIGYARPIGKIEFAGKPGRRDQRGASAQVRRGGGRKVYPGSFIAVGRSGNRQMFERTTKARLPIQALYGPSLADMLGRRARRARLSKYALELQLAELDRLVGALR